MTRAFPPRIVSSAPVTCGELVQGPCDGRLLQITCPIDLRSVVSVRRRIRDFVYPGNEKGDGSSTLPLGRGLEGSPKTRRAVMKAIRRWGDPDHALEIALRSPAPRGKGMGSSSADILAGTAAAARALGHVPSPEELAAVALSVEPTDGTMIEGLALFDHRQGRIRTPLGRAPAIRVLVLDSGGVVDSAAFNASVGSRPTGWAARRWAEAFRLVIDGIDTGDLEAIGRGATLSARLHQGVLPKPHFLHLVRSVREWGGVGVNVAHSGTVMGLLFPDEPDLVQAARCRVRHRFPAFLCFGSHRIVNGGVHVDAPSTPPESSGHRLPATG